MDIFEGLSERQREAVETIDDDLEIIACAGAGKTGVVTRRIVNILKLNPGVLPEKGSQTVRCRRLRQPLRRALRRSRRGL